MLPELAAVTLVLQPRTGRALPQWMGRAAQAFFLKSLERIHPALSAAAHDGDRLKPFTASTLIDRSGQPLQLRYTTLHPHLSAVLLNGLVPAWCADGVAMHNRHWAVESARVEGVASFSDLLAEADPRRQRVRLDFRAPTAFKKTDGPFVPLPLPELVFGSLLDRWNYFSPVPLPDTVRDPFARGIAIEQAQISTQEVRFGKDSWSGVVGFTGSVTYRIEAPDEAVRQAISALAAFAMYSGAGVKSATGMGQVGEVSGKG